jgi:capsular polysaccharide biosynthesis protein
VELRRYLRIFRNHTILIVSAVIVALLIGWGTSPRLHRYAAVASMYVGPNAIPSGPTASANGIATAQQIIYTYSKMVVSRPIIEQAVQRTGGVRSVDVAQAETKATQVPFTQLLNVVVTDRDPAVAASLANATVAVFQAKASTFDNGDGVPTFPVFPFESAAVPSRPLASGLQSRMITSFIFGIVIGLLAALVVEYLDLTIKAAADATRRLELPVLGAIPMQRQRA